MDDESSVGLQSFVFQAGVVPCFKRHRLAKV